MAISTISISLDSSEESVGTPSRRVLWLGRIPTIVPVTTPTIDPPVIHDDTSLIPTETPTISHITSTISRTALTTHYTSPFIHTNPSDDDTPDTPPSPTHEIPPVEVAPPTDYFTFDDSSRDSPSDSSSETPSDSSSDALSDSSSGHSSLDHSLPTLPSGIRSSHQLCSSAPSIPHSPAAITERPSHSSSVGPSRKKSRSPTIYVPVSSPIPGALSYVRADLLPPRKRIRSPNFVTDLQDCSDESSESFAKIDECIAYVDALRAKGIDARVVVETDARKEVESSARGMVESDVHSERISDLERDNTRLRGMLDVAKALEARDAARNLEPLAEGGDGQGGKNSDNYEGEDRGGDGNGNGNEGGNDNGNGNEDGNGNGGGNGYENHNMNFGGFRAVARECTYQDFLNALTWWNTHKRQIRIEAAYAMTWTKLMKLMTKVYCPRNKIQKMETELQNLTVKENYLTAYTRRFQELVMLCTRMVLNEEGKVERFIGGLPDNI
ncbi:putative reverse transcriptase domain-containing protein [Tanacetum coccineum]